MTDAHWVRIKNLFEDAIEQPPEALEAWLDANCADDDAVRRQLESLLAAHRAAGEFIETPAIAAIGAARAVADALAPHVRTAMTGRRLGPYRIVGELARGGMGVVYLGERDDATFRRQVAIKMMSSGLAHPALVGRFDAERGILASLEHPNIARLLDAGTDEGGTPFVVMEFIKGIPIDVYVREQRLSIRRRLELFLAVCDAVQYSHQRLVVHRDIKPGNILVTADGVPKLLDFGIAKLLDESAGRAGRTRTEFRALTPESASPEQIRGDPVTVATDVYSLGVLLYRLLTDRSPYRASPTTDADMVRVICDEDPIRPSDAVSTGAAAGGQNALSARDIATRRREIAGDLDLITIKALRKEPARRYGTVERFAGDIRRHLRREPVEAVPDTWRYRAGKFLRRHRVGVTATGAVVLTVVAGLAGTLWEARVARLERARAERRFNDVRGLAHSVMYDLHDAIEPLPGSTAARELLVQQALLYLDRLAADEGSDVSLQRELAAAYTRIGTVQGYAGRDNLGRSKASLESYRKALAIGERLARAVPGDPGVLDDLARGHRSVGLLLSQTGDSRGALEHLRTAVAIHQRLADQRPADTARQVALAESYQSLGDGLVTTEDWPGVLEMRLKVLPLLRSAVERGRGEAGLRRSLALAYKRLGAIQAKLGHFPEGLEAYRAALAIEEARLAAHPDSPEARLDVSFSVSDVGFILWQSGDRRAALQQVLAGPGRARGPRARRSEEPAHHACARGDARPDGHDPIGAGHPPDGDRGFPRGAGRVQSHRRGGPGECTGADQSRAGARTPRHGVRRHEGPRASH